MVCVKEKNDEDKEGAGRAGHYTLHVDYMTRTSESSEAVIQTNFSYFKFFLRATGTCTIRTHVTSYFTQVHIFFFFFFY
jgi:hypothetical protein